MIVIRCIAAISPTLKSVQGEDVKVRSMFPVAAGDRYKWPLLAVLSHAEQPNESAGERRTQELPHPPSSGLHAPSTRFSPSNSLTLSTSITQFKTEAHSSKLSFSLFSSIFFCFVSPLLLLSFSIHHSPNLHPLASVVAFASFSLSPERHESKD